MYDYDVVVVGSGLFGSVAAAALRREGMDVCVIDSEESGAGSTPAACLIKPSWISSLGREIIDPSMQLLDELYGVQDITFSVGPLKSTVHWVQPSKILKGSNFRGRVNSLEPLTNGWATRGRTPMGESFEMTSWEVVVATGVWARQLVQFEEELKGQAGMAFLWPGATLDKPFISPWAPYKQLVAFNRGDGLWVGDGTSILDKNWTEEHARKSEQRCTSAVFSDKPREPVRLYGIRPYVKAKPCLLRELKPGLWVATGGAKNGTLAAGWCGHVLAEALS